MISQEFLAIAKESISLKQSATDNTQAILYDVWNIGSNWNYDQTWAMTIANTTFSHVLQLTGMSSELLLAEVTDLHTRKNAGYSGMHNPDPWANFRAVQQLGISPSMGVLVRMSDKWSRYNSLLNNLHNGQLDDEGITDTLIDLGCYAIIYYLLLQEPQYAQARD